MTGKIDQEPELTVNRFATFAWVALGAIVFTYTAWFYIVHGYGPSMEPANWGTFGDFVGGLGNPIVSLCTLVIVAKAYQLQRRELHETKTALTESAAEQKRLSRISLKQAQIHAQTAILELERARFDHLTSEIVRLADTNHSWIMTSEGQVLSGTNDIRSAIEDLTRRARAASNDILEARAALNSSMEGLLVLEQDRLFQEEITDQLLTRESLRPAAAASEAPPAPPS